MISFRELDETIQRSKVKYKQKHWQHRSEGDTAFPIAKLHECKKIGICHFQQCFPSALFFCHAFRTSQGNAGLRNSGIISLFYNAGMIVKTYV